MKIIKNSIETPSFGDETEILFDSIKAGINPENERIIVDSKSTTDKNGNLEKWVSIRRLDSVRVIAEKNGEIYFAKQNNANGKSHYHIFGGSVNNGETHEEAAKRELMEEAGMAGNMELLMKWENPDGRLKWVWSIWIAHDVEIVAEQNLSGCENIEIVKVKNFNEFIKVITNTHTDSHIPFKDKNFLAILNNYTPINPTAMQAIAEKIHI